MTTILLQQYCARFSDNFSLRNIDWEIKSDQHWAIMGPNGAGKSALAALLAGEGEWLSGTLEGLPLRVATVSADIQAELIARERRNDESDISGVISPGTPVHELLEEVTKKMGEEEDKEWFGEMVRFLARSEVFIVLTENGVALGGGILDQAVVLMQALRDPRVKPITKIVEGLTLTEALKEEESDQDENPA